MKADHMLHDRAGIPAIARRAILPFPIRRNNGVAKPSTYRQVPVSQVDAHPAIIHPPTALAGVNADSRGRTT